MVFFKGNGYSAPRSQETALVLARLLSSVRGFLRRRIRGIKSGRSDYGRLDVEETILRREILPGPLFVQKVLVERIKQGVGLSKSGLVWGSVMEKWRIGVRIGPGLKVCVLWI